MVRTEASVAGRRRYARYLYPHLFVVGGSQALTANRLHYSPIDIPERMTVDGIIVLHDAVAAGNLYVALYDATDEAPVNRLAVSANTPVNGINRKQCVLFTTSIQITRGYHFISMVPDDVDSYYVGVPAIAAAYNPAGMDHGPLHYQEDLGAFIIPPVVATPVKVAHHNQTTAQILRVASVP